MMTHTRPISYYTMCKMKRYCYQVNNSVKEDRMLLAGAQKLLLVFVALLQAGGFVLSGMASIAEGTDPMSAAVSVLVVVQVTD